MPSPKPPKSPVKNSRTSLDLPAYTGNSPDDDLKNLASQHGYDMIQVKGDGDCMFRAISASLEWATADGKKYSRKILRSMVVDYLELNPSFLDPYLPYVTEQANITPAQYIENLKKTSTWGDLVCLKVLSKLLKVAFNLLILNTETFQTVAESDLYQSMIPLGFIDEYHYTGLRRKREAVKVAVDTNFVVKMRPSVVPEVVAPEPPAPSAKPSASTVFLKGKPLVSVKELLDIMDKVRPYVHEDIYQLQKADRQIMVSLGM
jgi:hypothetical protein